MKVRNPTIKISSIYYINNAPLLTLQSIRKEFNLCHSCEVKYFDSNFFFLQIDWSNFNFQNINLSDFKNNIIFNSNDSPKQQFLIPVAVLINDNLISYSHFIRLLDCAAVDNFDMTIELANCVTVVNSIFPEINIFFDNPLIGCFDYIPFSGSFSLPVNSVNKI